MASKYIQKFPTPEGFPEILSDLAKEVLRNQPEDILDFCALYFQCLQEGTVLDYANRGQNIPCDFKTSTPTLSERVKRKKPLNVEDEALHNEAVEKSAKIAKKPTGQDPILLAEEKAERDLKKMLENKEKADAQNLVNDLKAKENEKEKSVKSDKSNKEKSVAGSNAEKSVSRTSEQMREIKAVSTKFVNEVMDKQDNIEVNREAELVEKEDARNKGSDDKAEEKDNAKSYDDIMEVPSVVKNNMYINLFI